MNFDVKDVKSWANRHDVKVGDEGYFADSIEELKTEDNRTRTIENIFDDEAFCFRSPTNKYSFFLPLDAVKKEKKYRPLKKIKDFHDCGVIKGEDDCLIGSVLTLRDKKNYNLTRDMKVTDVEYSFDTVLRINRCSLVYFFSYFDIYINGEWVPFGVEVEDDE